MANINNFQNKNVMIENYQTTFLVLKIDDELIRFDFIDKKEFNLQKGTFGQLILFEKHPLLIDYNENIIETYINSKPDYFEDFLEDFKNAINEITEGWRQWTDYVIDKRINLGFKIFLNNVKTGHGKLIQAPFTITQNIIEVCKKHNVSVKSFGTELKQNDYKLIFIGESYVIAKEFRLRENANK